MVYLEVDSFENMKLMSWCSLFYKALIHHYQTTSSSGYSTSKAIIGYQHSYTIRSSSCVRSQSNGRNSNQRIRTRQTATTGMNGAPPIVTPAFMKHGVKYRGELTARFLPHGHRIVSVTENTTNKSEEEENCCRGTTCDDSNNCHNKLLSSRSNNCTNTNTNANTNTANSGILFLPSHTLWNTLPFTNQIISSTSAMEAKAAAMDEAEEVVESVKQKQQHSEHDDDNDLMLTMDISFQDTNNNVSTYYSSNSITELHMTRNPKERILDTLQRMKLSIDKKISQRIHKDNNSKNHTWKKYYKQQHQQENETSSTNSSTSSSNDSIIFSCTNIIRTTDASEEVRFVTLDISKVVSVGDLFRQLALLSLQTTSAATASIVEEKTIASHHHTTTTAPSSYTEEEEAVRISMWLPQHSLCLDIKPLPPTILDVRTFEKFQQDVFVGVPLVVEYDLMYANFVTVMWYVDDSLVMVSDNDTTMHYIPTPADIGKHVKVTLIPARRRMATHTYYYYGQAVTHMFHQVVTPIPFMPIVHKLRLDWLTTTSTNNNKDQNHMVRVVSYNLLADVYESQELFDDNKPRHDYLLEQQIITSFKRAHRFPMIVSELLTYRADVLCLQEVDEFILDTYLRPTLVSMGYQGYFSKKTSFGQKEGCAIFWLTNKFTHVGIEHMHTYSINQLFDESTSTNDDDYGISKINKFMDQHDELRSITKEKIGQIMQVVTLQVRPRRSSIQAPSSSTLCNTHEDDMVSSFVVANTHLFFHPMADHIRAMQTLVVCRKLDQLRRQNNSILPFILCGDLNSTPNSGTLHLLLQRKLLPDQCNTWKYLHSYTWDMPLYNIDTNSNNKALEGFESENENVLVNQQQLNAYMDLPTLELPSTFPPLVSGCCEEDDNSSSPSSSNSTFTHYVYGFVGTLDYILASPSSCSISSNDESTPTFGFERVSSAPMPRKNGEITQSFTVMPNEGMPSDHISLVCDFKLCRNGTNPNRSIV